MPEHPPRPGTAEFLASKLSGITHRCAHFPKFKSSVDSTIPSRLGFFNSHDERISVLETIKVCLSCLEETVPEGYNAWCPPGSEATSASESSRTYPAMISAGEEGFSQEGRENSLLAGRMISGKTPTGPVSRKRAPMPKLDEAPHAWVWLQRQRKPFYVNAIHATSLWNPLLARKTQDDAKIAAIHGHHYTSKEYLGQAEATRPCLPHKTLSKEKGTIDPGKLEQPSSSAQRKENPYSSRTVIPNKPVKEAPLKAPKQQREVLDVASVGPKQDHIKMKGEGERRNEKKAAEQHTVSLSEHSPTDPPTKVRHQKKPDNLSAQKRVSAKEGEEKRRNEKKTAEQPTVTLGEHGSTDPSTKARHQNKPAGLSAPEPISTKEGKEKRKTKNFAQPALSRTQPPRAETHLEDNKEETSRGSNLSEMTIPGYLIEETAKETAKSWMTSQVGPEREHNPVAVVRSALPVRLKGLNEQSEPLASFSSPLLMLHDHKKEHVEPVSKVSSPLSMRCERKKNDTSKPVTATTSPFSLRFHEKENVEPVSKVSPPLLIPNERKQNDTSKPVTAITSPMSLHSQRKEHVEPVSKVSSPLSMHRASKQTDTSKSVTAMRSPMSLGLISAESPPLALRDGRKHNEDRLQTLRDNTAEPLSPQNQDFGRHQKVRPLAARPRAAAMPRPHSSKLPPKRTLETSVPRRRDAQIVSRQNAAGGVRKARGPNTTVRFGTAPPGNADHHLQPSNLRLSLASKQRIAKGRATMPRQPKLANMIDGSARRSQMVSLRVPRKVVRIPQPRRTGITIKPPHRRPHQLGSVPKQTFKSHRQTKPIAKYSRSMKPSPHTASQMASKKRTKPADDGREKRRLAGAPKHGPERGVYTNRTDHPPAKRLPARPPHPAGNKKLPGQPTYSGPQIRPRAIPTNSHPNKTPTSPFTSPSAAKRPHAKPNDHSSIKISPSKEIGVAFVPNGGLSKSGHSDEEGVQSQAHENTESSNEQTEDGEILDQGPNTEPTSDITRQHPRGQIVADESLDRGELGSGVPQLEVDREPDPDSFTSPNGPVREGELPDPRANPEPTTDNVTPPLSGQVGADKSSEPEEQGKWNSDEKDASLREEAGPYEHDSEAEQTGKKAEEDHSTTCGAEHELALTKDFSRPSYERDDEHIDSKAHVYGDTDPEAEDNSDSDDVDHAHSKGVKQPSYETGDEHIDSQAHEYRHADPVAEKHAESDNIDGWHSKDAEQAYRERAEDNDCKLYEGEHLDHKANASATSGVDQLLDTKHLKQHYDAEKKDDHNHREQPENSVHGDEDSPQHECEDLHDAGSNPRDHNDEKDLPPDNKISQTDENARPMYDAQHGSKRSSDGHPELEKNKDMHHDDNLLHTREDQPLLYEADHSSRYDDFESLPAVTHNNDSSLQNGEGEVERVLSKSARGSGYGPEDDLLDNDVVRSNSPMFDGGEDISPHRAGNSSSHGGYSLPAGNADGSHQNRVDHLEDDDARSHLESMYGLTRNNDKRSHQDDESKSFYRHRVDPSLNEDTHAYREGHPHHGDISSDHGRNALDKMDGSYDENEGTRHGHMTRSLTGGSIHDSDKDWESDPEYGANDEDVEKKVDSHGEADRAAASVSEGNLSGPRHDQSSNPGGTNHEYPHYEEHFHENNSYDEGPEYQSLRGVPAVDPGARREKASSEVSYSDSSHDGALQNRAEAGDYADDDIGIGDDVSEGHDRHNRHGELRSNDGDDFSKEYNEDDAYAAKQVYEDDDFSPAHEKRSGTAERRLDIGDNFSQQYISAKTSGKDKAFDDFSLSQYEEHGDTDQGHVENGFGFEDNSEGKDVDREEQMYDDDKLLQENLEHDDVDQGHGDDASDYEQGYDRKEADREDQAYDDSKLMQDNAEQDEVDERRIDIDDDFSQRYAGANNDRDSQVDTGNGFSPDNGEDNDFWEDQVNTGNGVSPDDREDDDLGEGQGDIDGSFSQRHEDDVDFQENREDDKGKFSQEYERHYSTEGHRDNQSVDEHGGYLAGDDQEEEGDYDEGQVDPQDRYLDEQKAQLSGLEYQHDGDYEHDHEEPHGYMDDNDELEEQRNYPENSDDLGEQHSNMEDNADEQHRNVEDDDDLGEQHDLVEDGDNDEYQHDEYDADEDYGAKPYGYEEHQALHDDDGPKAYSDAGDEDNVGSDGNEAISYLSEMDNDGENGNSGEHSGYGGSDDYGENDTEEYNDDDNENLPLGSDGYEENASLEQSDDQSDDHVSDEYGTRDENDEYLENPYDGNPEHADSEYQTEDHEYQDDSQQEDDDHNERDTQNEDDDSHQEFGENEGNADYEDSDNQNENDEYQDDAQQEHDVLEEYDSMDDDKDSYQESAENEGNAGYEDSDSQNADNEYQDDAQQESDVYEEHDAQDEDDNDHEEVDETEENEGYDASEDENENENDSYTQDDIEPQEDSLMESDIQDHDDDYDQEAYEASEGQNENDSYTQDDTQEQDDAYEESDIHDDGNDDYTEESVPNEDSDNYAEAENQEDVDGGYDEQEAYDPGDVDDIVNSPDEYEDG